MERQLLWTRLSALTASFSSMTAEIVEAGQLESVRKQSQTANDSPHEMLISEAPWLIISMLTFPSASVVNMRPEIPTMFCSRPTSERMAMSLRTVT